MITAINATRMSVPKYDIKRTKKGNMQFSKNNVNFGLSDNAKKAGGIVLSLGFAGIGTLIAGCNLEDMLRASALGGGWLLAIATGFITSRKTT